MTNIENQIEIKVDIRTPRFVTDKNRIRSITGGLEIWLDAPGFNLAPQPLSALHDVIAQWAAENWEAKVIPIEPGHTYDALKFRGPIVEGDSKPGGRYGL